MMFCFLTICLIAVLNIADAQVYSNSRQSLSNRNRAVNSGLSIGRRWNSNNTFRNRTPDWNLRAPGTSYRNQHVHQSATNGFTSRLPIRSYSTYPGSRIAYGNYVGNGWPYGGYLGVGIGNFGIPGYIGSPLIYQPLGGYPVPYGGAPTFGTTTIQVTPPPPIPATSNANFGPSNPTVLSPSPVPVTPMATQNGEPLSMPLPADESPVLDEFSAAPIVQLPDQDTDSVDRIRSLRYQTSGDGKFRRAEFADAMALYKQASTVAPKRAAPAIRMVWAHVAQRRFDQAVVQLKAALQVPPGRTSAWIPAVLLYGPNQVDLIQQHEDALWNWLQQRPNSTDRLMLISAWQMLRGYDGVASELLSTAKSLGLEADKISRLRALAAATPNQEDGI